MGWDVAIDRTKEKGARWAFIESTDMFKYCQLPSLGRRRGGTTYAKIWLAAWSVMVLSRKDR